MRRFTAALMALILIFTLCACGKKDNGDAERECGVYITMEADDVFTVSCGTEQGSESYSNADKSAIAVGDVIHFDFAGEKADSSEPVEIDYSICIYDENLDTIAVRSFTDDFSNHARIDITVTADHRIINSNAGSSGDVVIEMSDVTAEDGVTYMTPHITMPTRAEAADKLNANIDELNAIFTGEQLTSNKAAYTTNIGDGTAEGLAPFSMNRTVRTERADSAIISFRVVDRASLGTANTLAITGHNYDAQTGDELKLADLGDDLEKIVNAVSENILVSLNEDEKYKDTFFTEGYTDTLRSLVSDGHWYLTNEGIVIIANPGEIADIANGFYEFTVGFDVIGSLIDERFLPAEHSGDDEGNVDAVFAEDADNSAFTLLGSDADENIKSIIVSAEGNVYDVNVYTINYHPENGSYTLVREIVYCSDMSDASALAINAELSSTEPGMIIRFTLSDGSAEERLLSLDENGDLKVTDPNAKNGKIITDRLPYSTDLDGDGKDETIDLSPKDNGMFVVVESNGVSYEAASSISPLSSATSLRLYDLDGDGSMEIYYCGPDADGKAVTNAFIYNSDAAEPLSATVLDGGIKEFSDGKLLLDTEVNILGTYKVSSFYILSGGAYTKDSGEIVFDNEDVFVTTTKGITLTSGSILQSGTKLRFTSTDGSSVINFVTDGGFTGAISIAHDGSGWTIAGQPDTSYFNSLPYKN